MKIFVTGLIALVALGSLAETIHTGSLLSLVVTVVLGTLVMFRLK